MSREFTYKQVAKHKSPGDLYTVVHDKVYNITNFVNEHP
jgi:cytochrome b involved in lipid metabolism